MDFFDIFERLLSLVGGQGLPLFLVVFTVLGIAWFIIKKLWPWYTDEHAPRKFQVELKRLEGDALMASAFQAQAQATETLSDVIRLAIMDSGNRADARTLLGNTHTVNDGMASGDPLAVR